MLVGPVSNAVRYTQRVGSTHLSTRQSILLVAYRDGSAVYPLYLQV